MKLSVPQQETLNVMRNGDARGVQNRTKRELASRRRVLDWLVAHGLVELVEPADHSRPVPGVKLTEDGERHYQLYKHQIDARAHIAAMDSILRGFTNGVLLPQNTLRQPSTWKEATCSTLFSHKHFNDFQPNIKHVSLKRLLQDAWYIDEEK